MTPWTFDALPIADLPRGRRYVTWNLERRGKVPYVPTCSARRASVIDASTWGTFDDARSSVEDGKADGLGLVLTGDLVAFDLDACIDGAGALAADAAAVLAALPTYTERSPSMRGLHVLLFGTLPAGRRRRPGLEVYDRDRFITLTGAHLADTPSRIVNQAAALTVLYPQLFPTRAALPSLPPVVNVPLTDSDAVLLEKAHRARNGAAFVALWAGDSAGYPSPSEGDLALCRHLAFWTQCKADRIDALFRQSGRMREKWDAVRGADTYGARTIAQAIAMTPAVYRPRVSLIDEVEVPMA